LVTGELLPTKDAETVAAVFSTLSPEMVSESRKKYKSQLVQIFIITASTQKSKVDRILAQNKWTLYYYSI